MTYQQALEDIEATTDWYGNRTLAQQRLTAINYLLTTRPQQSGHVGTSMGYDTEWMRDERRLLTEYMQASNARRVSFTRGRMLR